MIPIEELEHYFDRLWPLPRSITGDAVRQTHDILAEIIPLNRIEVPTGTRVLDWTVPKEWVLREAYVIDPNGRRILDVGENNLHLLGYSIGFTGTLSREEFDQFLFSLPDKPDAIPYITSYYNERWGFCLSHNDRKALPDGDYQIVIDTDLIDGSLTISDCVLAGESDQEILISTYTCHPSMANNEISGPLVAAFLYRQLAALPKRRFTYRFVFAPETIGAIAYLSQFGDHLNQHLYAGFIVSCVGDKGSFSMKRSRRGDSIADRATEQVLKDLKNEDFSILDFHPTGSDERQYCSPGYNFPVVLLTRTMPTYFPEYHTSLDNKDFICFEAMAESVSVLAQICNTLEENRCYRSKYPFGEPNLGSRGLYPTLGGQPGQVDMVSALMWVINMSDGNNDLLDIAGRSNIPVPLLAEQARKCLDQDLFEICDNQ